MSKKKRYDWNAVQRFYDKGNSIRKCVQKFGMAKRTFEKAVERGDVATRPQRLPIEYYTGMGQKTSRHYLKRRLLEDGILENKCQICGLGPWWMGKPLTLDMDHIDGNKNNNNINNLRILCGHCHRQTDTYSGKNRARKRKKVIDNN